MNKNSIIGHDTNFPGDHDQDYYINSTREEAESFTSHYKIDPTDKETFDGRPIINHANALAHAALSFVRSRGFDDQMSNYDDDIKESLVDTMTEIIQIGLNTANPYENIRVVDAPAKEKDWPKVDGWDLPEGRDVWAPEEVREQLYDMLIDKAIDIGSEPGDYTPVERCIKTVRSVLDIIDGGETNNETGHGLPLMQLVLSPHPDYVKAQIERRMPQYDNSVPLDSGLDSDNHQTGLARDFDAHFDHRFKTQITERKLRAAKDLFGDKS